VITIVVEMVIGAPSSINKEEYSVAFSFFLHLISTFICKLEDAPVASRTYTKGEWPTTRIKLAHGIPNSHPKFRISPLLPV